MSGPELEAAREDLRFMRLALALARRGLGNTWPNPAVGAVVVRVEQGDSVVVGRGWTQPGGRPHAETEALRRAGERARGATLYVTLEPCSHHGRTPPCADAIVAAGIARVVSAIEDPNPEIAGRGHARLQAAGIVVDVGTCAAEAARANAGHIRRMREGRPHVLLKLAVSADGKAGLAGRRPLQITGEEVRDRVHLLRARNDAILIGIGTAIADDPLLTCRLPGMAARSPVRVVLDSRLRLSPASRLARTAHEIPVWVVAGPDAPEVPEKVLRGLGVDVLRLAPGGGRTELAEALRLLAERGITRLMLEGGPTLAASAVKADLVDDAAIFRSDRAIGPDGIDALEGLPLEALAHAGRLVSSGLEKFGPDTLEHFERPVGTGVAA